MISTSRLLPDGRVAWTYEGWPLPPPEGQRWPSPFERSMYFMGQGYDCHANFMTPDKYLYDYLPRVCKREPIEKAPS